MLSFLIPRHRLSEAPGPSQAAWLWYTLCTSVSLEDRCWNPDVHLWLSPCPEAELSSHDAHRGHKAEGMNGPSLTEDVFWGFPCGSVVKNPPANAGDAGDMVFNPWVEKIPRRREQLPTAIFWPGELHGLCNPWGHKELGTTEPLSLQLKKSPHSNEDPAEAKTEDEMVGWHH